MRLSVNEFKLIMKSGVPSGIYDIFVKRMINKRKVAKKTLEELALNLAKKSKKIGKPVELETYDKC